MRVAHYLNQFFGGIGAEEHAGKGLEIRTGAVGPGRLLEQMLGSDAGTHVVSVASALTMSRTDGQIKRRSSRPDGISRYWPTLVKRLIVRSCESLTPSSCATAMRVSTF